MYIDKSYADRLRETETKVINDNSYTERYDRNKYRDSNTHIVMKSSSV